MPNVTSTLPTVGAPPTRAAPGRKGGAPATAGVRLLYPLNVTNPSRLWADSGWVFADLLAPALLDLGAQQVTVVGPVGVSDRRVGHAPADAPATKYRARFGLDVEGCAGLLRTVRPDVVVANQASP
jgi:hypothetical protein